MVEPTCFQNLIPALWALPLVPVLSDEKACCLSYGTAEHVGRQLGGAV